MSQSVQVLHVDTPAMPRGAALAAAVYQGLVRLLHREPAPLTRTQEAAAVRLMAMNVEQRDPGFAADLYAAACRHEQAEETTAAAAR